jgi:hypothetical protein
MLVANSRRMKWDPQKPSSSCGTKFSIFVRNYSYINFPAVTRGGMERIINANEAYCRPDRRPCGAEYDSIVLIIATFKYQGKCPAASPRKLHFINKSS